MPVPAILKRNFLDRAKYQGCIFTILFPFFGNEIPDRERSPMENGDRENSGLFMIARIESFEITITERLFFTRFECEKKAVSMFLADIGKTATE